MVGVMVLLTIFPPKIPWTTALGRLELGYRYPAGERIRGLTVRVSSFVQRLIFAFVCAKVRLVPVL